LDNSFDAIQFGTDGWRGILGVDFTLERLLMVAKSASYELLLRSQGSNSAKRIIVGYDRRFMADSFAKSVAEHITGCGFDVFLANTALPTPACSLAVLKYEALGALIITASHNPPEWLGLKIKGSHGASVREDFTQAVENRIKAGGKIVSQPKKSFIFDGYKEHIFTLKEKFNIKQINQKLHNLGLKIVVDPMYGSAAGCLETLFQSETSDLFEEIHSNRDPTFGNASPEPIETNLERIIGKVLHLNTNNIRSIGIVFDGDGDRIAIIDELGRYCSTQVIIPLLIDFLVRKKSEKGIVLKTISGSDIMNLISIDLGLEIKELPVGFKYIASEMLTKKILIGGEESGGIGFGSHMPERDALYAALVLLDAISQYENNLASCLDEIQQKYGPSFYDRIDITLTDLNSREVLEQLLLKNPPESIEGNKIKEVNTLDGIKLRISDKFWLLFRFSGTEPLLRIYCEAPNTIDLDKTLKWAINYARNI